MSRTVEAKILKGFMDDGRGGNPAGLLLDADELTAEDKLAIAAGLGLSETAFFSHSESCTYKVEFFTPTRQIAHCGHATIAAFSYLAQQGVLPSDEVSKETVDGPRKILIRDGAAYMEQSAPKFLSLEDAGGGTPEEVLGALKLNQADLLPKAPLQVVDTGNRFLIVPLQDEATVLRAKPDQESVAQISERLDLIGFYLFSTDTKVPGRDAGTRMFAPRYGIDEEAATGMAAGPLACYLHTTMGKSQDRFTIEQGCLMTPPSPSVIHVDLEIADGEIRRLMAGGFGGVVETREIAF